MHRRINVYLDTSVISALFDERNPERQALTKSFFKRIHCFNAHISEIVIVELHNVKDAVLKKKLTETAQVLSTLPIDETARKLAHSYVTKGAIPSAYPEDALHIAIAALNGIDYLLSWNFKHIVKVKTRNIVNMVNYSWCLPSLEIVTPAELL